MTVVYLTPHRRLQDGTYGPIDDGVSDSSVRCYLSKSGFLGYSKTKDLEISWTVYHIPTKASVVTYTGFGARKRCLRYIEEADGDRWNFEDPMHIPPDVCAINTRAREIVNNFEVPRLNPTFVIKWEKITQGYHCGLMKLANSVHIFRAFRRGATLPRAKFIGPKLTVHDIEDDTLDLALVRVKALARDLFEEQL